MSLASPGSPNSPRLGQITEDQHKKFWSKVVADDIEQHNKQQDRKKIEQRNKNQVLQDQLRSQIVQKKAVKN